MISRMRVKRQLCKTLGKRDKCGCVLSSEIGVTYSKTGIKGMLLRAGPGWSWFRLEKQSPPFFFWFKAVTFVLEEQDRFQTESTASKRSTWLLFTWRLESKRKWARQRDKEHKLLDSKRHEHTEGPVSILVWATRVCSEESKLWRFWWLIIGGFLRKKKWEAMERSQLGKSVRWYFGDVSPTAGWKLH